MVQSSGRHSKKSILHREMPFFAAFNKSNYAIGFVALKIHNEYSVEMFNLGVLEEYHRQGVGSALLTAVENYCKEYDIQIEKFGGIDIQLLGIGVNGHIGFNEPADELVVGTHLTDLTEDTIKANSRFFESIDQVPTKAITMGLGSIMKAKKILLLANGKNKAPIIAKLIKGGVVTTQNPASFLLIHPDSTIIIDEEAASEL